MFKSLFCYILYHLILLCCGFKNKQNSLFLTIILGKEAAFCDKEHWPGTWTPRLFCCTISKSVIAFEIIFAHNEVKGEVDLEYFPSFIFQDLMLLRGFPGGSVVKNSPAMQETQVRSPGQEDPLEKEMATHASTLAWRIPRTEESGRLQSMGSQRVNLTKQLNNKNMLLRL